MQRVDSVTAHAARTANEVRNETVKAPVLSAPGDATRPYRTVGTLGLRMKVAPTFPAQHLVEVALPV